MLEISQDHSTDIEFFLHIIEWMEINEGYIPEYFVHLRPTTPLRDILVLDKIKESGSKAICVINKVDQVDDKNKLLPLIDNLSHLIRLKEKVSKI